MGKQLKDYINFKVFKTQIDDLCNNDLFTLEISKKYIDIFDREITKIDNSKYMDLILNAIKIVDKKKYRKLKDKYISKYNDEDDETSYFNAGPSLFFKLDDEYYLFYIRIFYNHAAGAVIELIGLINIITSKYIILGNELNFQVFIRCNDFSWRYTDEQSAQSYMNMKLDRDINEPYITDNTTPNTILRLLLKYFTSICENKFCVYDDESDSDKNDSGGSDYESDSYASV